MNRLLIDIGSTYFKIAQKNSIRQYMRNFDISIKEDLYKKSTAVVGKYDKDDIYICSSANGGLNTLIIGLSEKFSLKYATAIAYNSGINIIDTVLYPKIESYNPPADIIDVVIIVGGIDSEKNIFDQRLIEYLGKVRYQNIVYVGSSGSREFLSKHIDDLVIFDNIINRKLKINENRLKKYLTDLYQADIVGKEDIKELYALTSNQIYSTPYIVNRAMPYIGSEFDVVDPFVLIDIGGATTDIHYSKDLTKERFTHSGSYDRLVFKKLGVFKSKQSLIYAAKNNEFVYELLSTLMVTENILEEDSDKALRVLMQLAVFLVLYKMSRYNTQYITLELERLKSIVITGGITKKLSHKDIETVVEFFYRKSLKYHTFPKITIDAEYKIWTIGATAEEWQRTLPSADPQP